MHHFHLVLESGTHDTIGDGNGLFGLHANGGRHGHVNVLLGVSEIHPIIQRHIGGADIVVTDGHGVGQKMRGGRSARGRRISASAAQIVPLIRGGNGSRIGFGLDSGHTMRGSGSIGLSFIPMIIMVAFMPFGGVKLVPMYGFDMFSEGTGVGIPFGTARRLTSVGFLKKVKET